MAFLSRGNPVTCCPKMHFLGEIERNKIVSVATVFVNKQNTHFLISLQNPFGFLSFLSFSPFPGKTVFSSFGFRIA